jgi:hypothetical protein
MGHRFKGHEQHSAVGLYPLNDHRPNRTVGKRNQDPLPCFINRQGFGIGMNLEVAPNAVGTDHPAHQDEIVPAVEATR